MVEAAAQFHSHFLAWLVDTANPLLNKDQPLEDTILDLSRWLGYLDLSTKDLAEVSKSSSIILQMPSIIISSPSGLLVRVTYDSPSSHSSFLPSKVFVTQPGKAEIPRELPSDMTPAQSLQQIFELYAK